MVFDYGTSLYVVLDGRYHGHVCGLCGDFDGNVLNDFRGRGGEIEATATAFGHSWRTIENCVEPEEVVHPCDLNPDRREWAMRECEIVLEDPFTQCHDVVS